MVDDSIRDFRRFYTFLVTSENLASLNHANKENKGYILLVIVNKVGKNLFFQFLGLLTYNFSIFNED